jgi:hypothetical protein
LLPYVKFCTKVKSIINKSATMCLCAGAFLPADAHNPLAERRLTKADFVSMNHTTSSEEGAMLPVLPVQQLEEIYERCGGSC